MSLPAIAYFLGGLVLLTLGAELILRTATRMAALLGISPLVIGLTVVSVGTSMPELAVGLAAVAEGRGALAVGNIAGTNILNILFILGLSAWIRPLPLQRLSISLDAPAMVASALVLVLMAADGMLTRPEGVMLLGGAVLYTVAVVRMNRREYRLAGQALAAEAGVEVAAENGPARPGSPAKAAWNIALLLVGMALTVKGADLLVVGAVEIARLYGVSDAVIGLTIVAMGTSAPELATTLVATFKGDRDVAVGNLIGSSIYNILVILGATCLAAPGGIEVSREILLIDLPLAAVVALVCVPVFRSGRLVSRREGGIFVACYLLYLATLLFLRT